MQGVLAQSWELSPMAPMPEPVTNNAVIEGFAGGVPYIYSFGGLDSSKVYSGIHLRSYRYNTLTNTWDTLAPLPDTLGKIAAAASRVKDKIYIIGGYHVYANGGEASSNKVHIFDPAINSYLPDGANIPIAIDDQVQAVWRDSLIYVITGWSNTANVNAVQIYNPSNDTWQTGTNVSNNNIYKSFGASGAIVGDTIYYFGGASMAGSFNVQFYFRRGIINPNNPRQIAWANFSWMGMRGYRMAATTALGQVFWLGGSDVTYNYNGIAYNGSGGVSPIGRSLSYDRRGHLFDVEYGYPLPMDLRGIGAVSDTVKYLAGGMQSNQTVTDQTWRLLLKRDSVFTSIPSLPQPLASPTLQLKAFPNPCTDFVEVDAEPTYKVGTWNYTWYNRGGVRLKEGTIGSLPERLDTKDLEAGIYWLALEAGELRLGTWVEVQ